MNIFFDRKGFTLIETLVAINLSFIGITMIVSLYLFVVRFTRTISDQNTNQYLYQNFFFDLEKCLGSSDNYNIENHLQYLILCTDKSDTLLIYKDSLILNGILKISEFDEKSVKIYKLSDNHPLLIADEDYFLEMPESIIKSREIMSIRFEIKTSKQNFNYEIFTRPFSVNRFANLIKEE